MFKNILFVLLFPCVLWMVSYSQNKEMNRDLSGDGFVGSSANSRIGLERSIFGKKGVLIQKELIDDYIDFEVRTPYSEEEIIDNTQPVGVRDPNLIMYDVNSDEYKSSRLYELIQRRRGKIRVYFLVKLKDMSIEKINFGRLGFQLQGDGKSQMNRHEIVVYGWYRSVKNIIGHPLIESVSVINRLTVMGYYSASFNPVGSKEEVEFKIATPKSKPGQTLIDRIDSLRGVNDNLISNMNDDGKTRSFTMDVRKHKRFIYISKVKYILDLEELLDHDIMVVGGGKLSIYKKLLAQDDFSEAFLSHIGKVDDFPFLDTFSMRINNSMSLRSIWLKIYKILNDSIIYDYKKRKDFFNGNIVYSDIREMYMKASELVRERIGACPERSSLEAAMFRKVGIATRITTRLYHIYVEVYIPGKGWVTTSPVIREIPLKISKTGDMSYFLDWNKKVPLKVRWKGGLTPILSY